MLSIIKKDIAIFSFEYVLPFLCTPTKGHFWTPCSINLQASSNLYISCNRQPGTPVSPDCRQGSSKKYQKYLTTSTTTTQPSTRTTSYTEATTNTEGDKSFTNTSSQLVDPDSQENNNNILLAPSYSHSLLYILSRYLSNWMFKKYTIYQYICLLQCLMVYLWNQS